MSPRVRDMVGWYSGTPFLFFWRQYTEQFTDNQVDHLEDNLTYLKQSILAPPRMKFTARYSVYYHFTVRPSAASGWTDCGANEST